jgi:hypothetical protein
MRLSSIRLVALIGRKKCAHDICGEMCWEKENCGEADWRITLRTISDKKRDP